MEFLFWPLQEFCTQPFIITTFQPQTDVEKLIKNFKSMGDCINRLSSKPVRQQPSILGENFHSYSLHHSARPFQIWLVGLLLKCGPEPHPVSRPKSNR